MRLCLQNGVEDVLLRILACGRGKLSSFIIKKLNFQDVGSYYKGALISWKKWLTLSRHSGMESSLRLRISKLLSFERTAGCVKLLWRSCYFLFMIVAYGKMEQWLTTSMFAPNHGNLDLPSAHLESFRSNRTFWCLCQPLSWFLIKRMRVEWRYGIQGGFSVSSIYQFINNKGIKCRFASLLWSAKLLLKVKCFMALLKK